MNDYDVAKIFEEIELDLIASMKRNLRGHELEELEEGFKWEQWQAKKLRELNQFRRRNKAVFNAHRKKLTLATRIDLARQFFESARRVDKEVKDAIKNGYITKSIASEQFFNSNKKLEALIKAVNDDMDKAEVACLRKMDDVYRATLYKSQMFSSSGDSTVGKAVDRATRDFLTNGITCITYSNGRNVGISTWARMAIRTANKRAFLMGEGERRKEWGESLVLVSQYLQCSPTCQPWQGKVYIDDVWSGGKAEDGPCPLLSLAISGGLYHPNCRHTQSTWFPDVSTIPEPMPVEVTKEEYDKARKEAYINQNIRKYQRLKEGSTDQTNIDKYKAKEKEWKSKLADWKEVKVKPSMSGSKQYEVNRDLVNSKAYTDKFSNIGFNNEVNRRMRNETVSILNHRNGTKAEDVVYLDERTGKRVLLNNTATELSGINLSKEEKDIIASYKGSLIAIHNHTMSSRPSIADLITYQKTPNMNKIVVAGHNGKVYTVDEIDRIVDLKKLYSDEYRYFRKLYGDDIIANEKAMDVIYSSGICKLVER